MWESSMDKLKLWLRKNSRKKGGSIFEIDRGMKTTKVKADYAILCEKEPQLYGAGLLEKPKPDRRPSVRLQIALGEKRWRGSFTFTKIGLIAIATNQPTRNGKCAAYGKLSTTDGEVWRFTGRVFVDRKDRSSLRCTMTKVAVPEISRTSFAVSDGTVYASVA